jgi:hypothetical protein
MNKIYKLHVLTIHKALSHKVKVKRSGVVFKRCLHSHAAACGLLLQLLRELPDVVVRGLQPWRGHLHSATADGAAW